MSANNVAQIKNNRLFYIDNIRWLMIILVLSMHAAVTYSNMGGWYYTEKINVDYPTHLFFLTYQSALQSFFMGLLFFIAGYFVPKAFDTKGAGRFLKDRLVRLGVPTLLYIFLIGPLTEYFVSKSWHPDPIGRSFLQEYKYYIIRFRLFGGTGPLWFCEALLIFCLTYVLFRKTFKKNLLASDSTPTNRDIVIFAGILALSTFLVRIPLPKGSSFYNLQLCYFAQYIIMFIAGTEAYRKKWLQNITLHTGLLWGRLAFSGGIVLWAVLIAFSVAFNLDGDNFGGGFHWESLGFCIWESLICTGVSLYIIVLFRERFNKPPGKPVQFFSANAFAVYVFHPPVLIALAIMLHSLQWHPVIKFILLTLLSVVATFTISEFLLRKIPLLKNIL